MSVQGFGKLLFTYSLGNILLRVTPFLLIPLFTHHLSKFDYGILSTLQYAIQIYIVVMGLGMTESVIRFAKEAETNEDTGTLLGSCLIFIFIGVALLTTITFLILPSIYRDVLHKEEVWTLLALLCFSATARCYCNFFLAYFRSLNKAKTFVTVNLTAAIGLFFISLVCVLVWPLGIRGVILAQIIVYGSVALGIFQFGLQMRLRVSGALIKRLAKFGLPVLVSAVAWITIGGSALMYISYFYGPEIVAEYALGAKLASVMYTVIVIPFQLTFDPYVFANVDHPDLPTIVGRVFTYFLIGFGVLAFCVLLGSRWCIALIAPPHFANSLGIFIMMLPLSIWLGVFTVGRSLLHIKNRTAVTASIVSASAVLCVILNYFIIHRYSVMGAVVFANILYPCISGLTLFYGLRTFKVHLQWKRICVILAAIGTMFVLFFTQRHASAELFYGTAAGTIVVATLLLWWGHFFTLEEINYIRNMKRNLLVKS